MAYQAPLPLIFQEFTATTLAVETPLRAIVVGPNAVLRRYSDEDEKSLIGLGAYDPAADENYEYPAVPTGGIVDQSYFKLFGEDVLLRYFHDPASSGGGQAAVSGYKNRVRSDTYSYKTHEAGGTQYSRSAELLDRDVTVGDVVDVSGVVDGEATTIRATVRSLVGDTVAASIDAATADDDNQETIASDSATVTQVAGAENCVSVAADAAGYDGAADGNITETYTIKVTRSSIGGDLTTARLRVTSASRNDDDTDVQPAAAGDPTAIGDRGLEVTFDTVSNVSCSLSADADSVSDYDLIEGQTWTVTVEQQFTAVVATSSGTYTGTETTIYIAEVTRGGSVSGTTKPQITCSTIHGTDLSAPVTVTASATAIAVGSQGVRVAFAQTVLRKGDKFYIAVTGQHEGAMKTLVLSKNLPEDMLTGDLGVSLYIRKDSVEIPARREGDAPNVNYDLGDAGEADTGFTVKTGMTLTDATWTDNGELQPLEIVEASLFAQYRAWVPDVADAVYGLSTDEDFDDIPGVTHQDNPLKYAVSKAFANSNGTEVLYIAVTDPTDTEAWQNAIEKLVGYRGMHGVVPCTKDGDILDLFAAHVTNQSSAEHGLWRALWATLSADATAAIVNSTTSEDKTTVLATISDDPDISDNQFVIVRTTNGNFVTNGVRAGDTVRTGYATDAWGDATYDEYTVDQVINEDELRLVAGPAAAVNVARKLEVWRTYSSAELATQLAGKSASYGNRRVRAVWPDVVTVNDEVVDSYYLAAALAGLRSGILSQQGMTKLPVAGFDDVPRTTKLFNKTQLDAMAESGVWIVEKNRLGQIVTRHALTTAGYGDVLTQEESIQANVDWMSMVNLESLEDLIGVVNITPGTADIISLRLQANIDRFKRVTNVTAGGNINDGEVVSVKPHTTMPDRMVAVVRYVVPTPLNNLELYEQIVV